MADEQYHKLKKMQITLNDKEFKAATDDCLYDPSVFLSLMITCWSRKGPENVFLIIDCYYILYKLFK